jgi:ribosomal protein S18 acetylase RimI-like enzyme
MARAESLRVWVTPRELHVGLRQHADRSRPAHRASRRSAGEGDQHPCHNRDGSDDQFPHDDGPHSSFSATKLRSHSGRVKRVAAVIIRDVTNDDIPFLQEMLYAAAFWRPEGGPLSFEAAMAHPYFQLYYAGWGRAADVGVIAQEGDNRIGACWYRLFTDESHGEGYIDEDTPELAIAVVEGYRGRGVGRELMNALHDRGRANGLARMGLSVNADNPAKHLYLSLGYVDYKPDEPGERMILDLS